MRSGSLWGLCPYRTTEKHRKHLAGWCSKNTSTCIREVLGNNFGRDIGSPDRFSSVPPEKIPGIYFD
jgi:hypothetical protein